MKNFINTICNQSLKEQKPIKMFLTAAVIEGTVTDIKELYIEMRTPANKRIIVKLVLS